MKKHTEKSPVDDLFAQKLGNLSLPPRADSFARLQTRLEQRRPKTWSVWPNSGYRYVAAAACLLLISTVGWLYWLPDADRQPDELAMSGVRQPKTRVGHVIPPLPAQKISGKMATRRPVTPDETAFKSINRPDDTEPLVERSGPTKDKKANEHLKNNPAEAAQPLWAHQSSRIPSGSNKEITAAPTIVAIPVEAAREVMLPKVAPQPERVLIVTIAEPASLVAARQAAQEAVATQPHLAGNDTPSKESKASNLWQQVQRLKQGEIMARRTTTDQDRSLLGRAYEGLKQTLDKDKSTKQ